MLALAMALGLVNAVGQVALPPVEYKYIPGLPEFSRAGDVLIDDRGLLWFAYDEASKGLYIYDGQKSYPLAADIGDSTALSDVNITFLQRRASDNTIWLGTRSQGVCIYDPTTDNFGRLNLAELTNSIGYGVWDMLNEGDSIFWFGTTAGLVEYHVASGQTGLFSYTGAELENQDRDNLNRIQRLIRDPINQNIIWLGTRFGLASFDKSTSEITRYVMPFSASAEVSLPNDQFLINAMDFYTDDLLVIGTWAGGIMTYNTRTGEWSRSRDDNVEKPWDVYFDLLRKDQNSYWIASTYGYGAFDIESRTFTYFDSLPFPEPYKRDSRIAGALQYIGENILVASGSKGAAVVHLNGDQGTSRLYPPLVREVIIDGERVTDAIITPQSRVIGVTPEQSKVEIVIAAPYYGIEREVQYRYLIEGQKRTWQYKLAREKIVLEELPEGEYTLRLEASVDGNTWIPGSSWQVRKYQVFWRSRNFLYIICSVCLLTALIVWRLLAWQRSKREKLEREYRLRLAESEMSALRAQMNPHFIFNSLNSIKMHVMKQDTEVANRYLTRFSHLMRLVLRNSKSKLITLTDELKALELYIEIEKLRFDDGFTSQINISEELDTDDFFTPPMLVQPYVENAIWHGLMHKQETGNLVIAISQRSGRIEICVQDDGVGREASRRARSSDLEVNKSYGMQITSDRIELVKQSLEIDASVYVDDLHDHKGQACGTKVTISLPLIDARMARKWLNGDPVK